MRAAAESESMPNEALAGEATGAGLPVKVERRGEVAWLTLNRPDRLNAVNLELYVGLTEAVRGVDRDEGIRAIVLTGAGRAFCAGADLKAHAGSTMTQRQRRRYARWAQRANLALQRSRKPVVAAVHGPAVGAGLELALSCDFIIVAAEARLRLPEVSLATFVGGGVTYTLPERVGMTHAKELILLGDFFTGERAAQIGLANRVVPAAEVHSAAVDLADRLARQAPMSVALAKRLLRRASRSGRRAAMEAEARALERCMATDDWMEGILAFREKRPPRYTGR